MSALLPFAPSLADQLPSTRQLDHVFGSSVGLEAIVPPPAAPAPRSAESGPSKSDAESIPAPISVPPPPTLPSPLPPVPRSSGGAPPPKLEASAPEASPSDQAPSGQAPSDQAPPPASDAAQVSAPLLQTGATASVIPEQQLEGFAAAPDLLDEQPNESLPAGAPPVSLPPGLPSAKLFIRRMLLTASLAGGLGATLALAGQASAVHTTRFVLIVLAVTIACAAILRRGRHPRALDLVTQLTGPLLAGAAAGLAFFGNEGSLSGTLTTAGMTVAALTAIDLVVGIAGRAVERHRQLVFEALDVESMVLRDGARVRCPASEVRPGEEVIVESGQTVPVDGTVVAGSGVIIPWRGAEHPRSTREGQPIVAGARVESGNLRVIAVRTHTDRAWVRLTNSLTERADLTSASARFGYLVAQRGAPLSALLAALTSAAVGFAVGETLAVAAAIYACLANASLAELGAIRVASASFEALHYGIAFRSARDFDTAGRVTIAAICARGTVLLGEPEIASIDPLQGYDAGRVLALAAGGETAVGHPIASAVLRAARARGVQADGVRSHTVLPGLGVTAVTADGEPLVVGSRALMLRERISVAIAEARITELEGMGRTGLLVAVGGRLVGIIALQDGLRPGARAAVQHLLDADTEPVLLSGDSRETTEAIGRTLGIEHIRPEIPAPQRGDEVRRLIDGGAVVAVVGRSPIDDVALSAADLSVAVGASAAAGTEFGVGLVSGDVRDAARAIRLARRARDTARQLLAIVVVPAGLTGLAVTFGLLPGLVAPLATLVGTIVAVGRLQDGRD